MYSASQALQTAGLTHSGPPLLQHHPAQQAMSSKQQKRIKDGGSYAQYQQKRRELALKRQEAARQQRVAAVRSLAQAAQQQDNADGTPDEPMQQDHATPMPAHQQQHHQHPPAAPSTNHHQQPPAAAAAATGGAGSSTEDTLPSQLYGLDGIDSSRLSGAALRSYFAQQLMVPEWLTDVPLDLAAAWLAMPRPEGKRCLVISSGGSTVSRTRTGAVLHRFHSRLPAGGPCSHQGSFCVLDCIYQQHDLPLMPHEQPQQQQQQQADVDMGGAGSSNGTSSSRGGSTGSDGTGSHCSSSSEGGGTYYVQDVLVWRGYSLVDCGADFRLFWLASKVGEEAEGAWSLDGGETRPGHAFRFKLLPFWPASAEGLTAAATAGSTTAAAAAAAPASNGTPQQQHHNHQQQQQQQQQQEGCSFTQDGVYLLHSQGHYALGGCSSPLALLWKDESCSRYLLDTDAAGVVPAHQQVVLVYQGPDTGGVATADEPPVVLGRLPAEFVASMSKVLRPGRLLRFSIREGGLLFSPADGSPAGADLAYEGPANQRRGRADSHSKVVFQWQARRQPLRLAALAAAAGSGAAGGGNGGGDGDGMQDDAQ